MNIFEEYRKCLRLKRRLFIAKLWQAAANELCANDEARAWMQARIRGASRLRIARCPWPGHAYQ